MGGEKLNNEELKKEVIAPNLPNAWINRFTCQEHINMTIQRRSRHTVISIVSKIKIRHL